MEQALELAGVSAQIAEEVVHSAMNSNRLQRATDSAIRTAFPEMSKVLWARIPSGTISHQLPEFMDIPYRSPVAQVIAQIVDESCAGDDYAVFQL
jgi:hypothetical protein